MRTTVAVCLAMALVCVEGKTQLRPRILIDAAGDVGLWWAPANPGVFPSGSYQGEGLTNFLRRRGADVQELREAARGGPPGGRGRGGIMTRELLTANDLVIQVGGRSIQVPLANQASLQGDIAAYREYVSGGGKLLLLSEYQRPNLADGLAESFGVRFMGVSTGENRIERFVPHPITRRVRNVPYLVGSGVVAAAPNVMLLGFLSNRTYLDLDGDKTRNAQEPVGAAVLGVVEFGRGVVVFIGDVNTLQRVPQPLTENIFDFLLGP